MSLPAISVVVPAHDAAATLPALLRALDDSTFEGEWELVLVDDGSGDGTADIAREWGAVVVELAGQNGPAEARNAGIARARSDLIAFTDADCEPTPGWIGELHAGLTRADLVTGPVRPVPGVPVGPYDRTLHVSEDSAWFETANLGVRKALAESIGAFSAFAPDGSRGQGLRPRVDQGHFGEDVLFGWRARRAGARIEFLPGALVHHAIFPRGARPFVAEHWRRRYFPALLQAVPELRSRFWARCFLDRRTAYFDLAVAGMLVVLAARRPWPALAVVPYAGRYMRGVRPWRPASVRHAVVLVMADAVSLAALARGSMSARTLVL